MPKSKVLDFLDKKNERNETKKRSFERVIFQNLMGAYSVVDEVGSIAEVKMIDFSRKGCLFEIEYLSKNKNRFKQGENVKMKMFFSNDNYLPIVVKIKHCMEQIGEGGRLSVRYGAEFDQSLKSFEALKLFIEFLYKFSEVSSSESKVRKVQFI